MVGLISKLAIIIINKIYFGTSFYEIITKFGVISVTSYVCERALDESVNDEAHPSRWDTAGSKRRGQSHSACREGEGSRQRQCDGDET